MVKMVLPRTKQMLQGCFYACCSQPHTFLWSSREHRLIFPLRLLLETPIKKKNLESPSLSSCPWRLSLPTFFSKSWTSKTSKSHFFYIFLLEPMHCTCGEERRASYLAIAEEYNRFHIIQHQSILASQEVSTLTKRNMYLQFRTSSFLHNTFFAFRLL